MNGEVDAYIKKQLNEVPLILNRQLSTRKNVKFNKRDDFDKIKQRLDEFLDEESDERFFVLPGLRGVGKTTLLFQSYEYLFREKNISPQDILYISCETIMASDDINIKELVEKYLSKMHDTTPALLDKPVFIFIDEVHYDKNWALNGKILFDQSPFIFMIFTGSSSLHLSYNADAARRLKIQTISPLNYSQHLKLKYNYHTDISDDLQKLIFNGEVEKAQEKEKQLKNDLINLEEYMLNDWNNYFKYGAFVSTLNKKHTADVVSELWSIISRIIMQDMTNIFNLNKNSQNNVFRVLTFLASQKPGEITQNKIAGHLSCSKSTVNSIVNILEETQLVFHCDSYGGSAKRVKKSWKYYIATPSIKHSINKEFGNTILDSSDYDGILLENLVATSLFNLSNNEDFTSFHTYYDSDNGGVDFLIQKSFEKPIPIEVGIGKKSNRQIKKAIDKFGVNYGIVISNKTEFIERKDDVIYIPPNTFSLV